MRSRSIRTRAPAASSPEIRKVMMANRGGNTLPERALRNALFQAGLRFRKDSRPVKSIRCRADIVFRSERVCIFVDGCFWHGCPEHFNCPRTHGAWWREKIQDNRERDKRQASELRAAGWKVVRVWEHELLQPRLRVVTARVLRKLGADPSR
jgi:DNA mismatch endonuclease, patch repair protein